MPVFTNINIATNDGSSGLSVSQGTGSNFDAFTDGFNEGAPGAFGDNPVVLGFAGIYKLDSFCFYGGNQDTTNSTTVTVDIYEGTAVASTNLSAYTLLGSASYVLPGNNFGGSAQKITLSGFTPEVFLQNGNQYFFIIKTSSESITYASVQAVNTSYGNRRIVVNGSDDITNIFTQVHTFRINMEGDAGVANDPLIHTFNKKDYYLPVDEKMYCLIDTQDQDDRLVINIKCHIRRCKRSYVRYVYVYYNGDEFIVRLPNLKVVEKGKDFDKLVEEQKLGPAKNQKVKGRYVREIKRSSKVRKILLPTKKYGDFHLVFAAGKFRFSIKGNPSRLNTEQSVGCMKGEEHMLSIDKLNHVPGIRLRR